VPSIENFSIASPAPGISADAHQLLLDILDTVREPLLVLDAEYRITQANRAFFETFRVEPSTTLGRELFSLGDGQWNVGPLRAMLRDRVVREPRVHELDIDHVFPGIGRKLMLLNARLVTRGPTAERAVLISIQDVTERRETERRLAVQHLELQRSNAALNEFASVASHDLQEPLRKILSFGERLSLSAGPLLGEAARGDLNRMLGAAARMRTLIGDVLAYSQITTGHNPFVRVDLGAVARQVVDDLQPSIAAADATVELGDLPLIEADPPQMRQLLHNLVGNAIKFRRADRPLVVRLGAAPARHGDFRAITVADNGIGFAQEHAETIFRMFERLHGRARYEGSGIGLAICRGIVERHGGTIAATSIAGQGAAFTVTLPVTQALSGYPS
jgi:signal transduction histidine kinase